MSLCDSLVAPTVLGVRDPLRSLESSGAIRPAAGPRVAEHLVAGLEEWPGRAGAALELREPTDELDDGDE